MALVFTLTHVFAVTVTASPEDWPSGPPFGHVDDPGVVTKAFINVTKEEEGEWKSQVDELGRLVEKKVFACLVDGFSNVFPSFLLISFCFPNAMVSRWKISYIFFSTESQSRQLTTLRFCL